MKRTTPMLSVVCVSYNQEQFIRAALDGFVTQKVNFEYEVLVADDVSSDSTRQIINEYAREYSFVHPILRKKNIGPIPNLVATLQQAKGKYVAICEGDDYWTDVTKLQKQVDFLELHTDYAVCFHPVKIVFEGTEEDDTIFPEATSGFTAKELLKHNFIQTNSVVYRRQNYENLPIDIMPGDWYLHLYHAKFGKIGFINEVMSVYRRHAGGIWWDQHKKPTHIWEKYGYNFLRLLHEIMLLYGNDTEYKKIIDSHIAGSYEAISSLKPQSVAEAVAVKSINGIPVETWDYMKHLMRQINEYAERETHLRVLIEQEKQANKSLSDELQNIKSSKLWRTLLVARQGSYSAQHPIKSAKRATRHVRKRASSDIKEEN